MRERGKRNEGVGVERGRVLRFVVVVLIVVFLFVLEGQVPCQPTRALEVEFSRHSLPFPSIKNTFLSQLLHSILPSLPPQLLVIS